MTPERLWNFLDWLAFFSACFSLSLSFAWASVHTKNKAEGPPSGNMGMEAAAKYRRTQENLIILFYAAAVFSILGFAWFFSGVWL